MTDDATLSDFGVDATDDPDDSNAGGGGSADEGTPSPTESDGARRDRGGPNPSLSTYAWGEHVCGRCGTESDRVWRDGDEFVCPDCKEW